MEPKTRTELVLKAMHILAWVAFIAFMVKAGVILVTYVISCIIPEGAKNLYEGLNLYDLRQNNFQYYTWSISFLLVLPILKSYISFLVIKALSKFSLKNPFSMEVARTLEDISFVAFGTWVVTMLSNAYVTWLMKITGKVYGNWLSGEFILMVGLVFIVSQVLKRGAEIQSETGLRV